MRKILVTGGSSFTGSSLIKYFNTRYPGFNVENLDRHDGIVTRELPQGEPDSQYNWTRGDFTNREQVWHHTILSELIVNCVWSEAGAVPMASNEYVETTMVGLNNLLQSATARNTSRFIQISTADVYGPRIKGVSKETDRIRPHELASGIRGAADVLVETFFNQYDLGILIVRPTNLYGSHMSSHELLPRVISKVCQGRALPGDMGPDVKRDWLHIDDFCRAVDTIIRQGKVGTIYNVGSGEVLSDMDLAGSIAAAAGNRHHSTLLDSDRQAGGVMVSTDRLRKLGWEPQKSLRESLPALLEMYGG